MLFACWARKDPLLPTRLQTMAELRAGKPAAATQTSRLLIPDVFLRVAAQLSSNGRALLMRPLCQEAKGLLSSPLGPLQRPAQRLPRPPAAIPPTAAQL